MAFPPTNRRPGVDADIFQGQWLRGFDVPAGNNDPGASPCDLIISNGKSQIDQTVSNLIFASRKDDPNQPIFVMAQGEIPTAPIGTVNFHIGREEDPNTLITSSVPGSLYSSYGVPGLWQLQVDATTWVRISDDLGGEDLQETLVLGNSTGGLPILLTNGDFLKGEDSSTGDGAGANIAGGNATGASGNGGDVNVFGGTTTDATGRTGNLLFSSPIATGTGGSGRFSFITGESRLGGGSGGFSVRTGDAGDVGFVGSGGSISLRSGRSFTTGAFSSGGLVDLVAGQATDEGQGGYLRLFSGNATTTSQSFPFSIFLPGRAGDIELTSGNSSGTNVGGGVTITAGTGGSAGGDGGQILLTPGAGGGGSADGEVVADGVFRADNIKRGNGDPNVGAVPGNEGDVYQRLDLGLGQIWLNTNGGANGWVQLAQTGDFIEAFEQMSWGWIGPSGTNVGGIEEDSYHDVGIWHGLRPNTSGASTIVRGEMLPDGPVLAFGVSTLAAGNWAALDLSAGVGMGPHERQNGFIATFRAKAASVDEYRAFLGFSTLNADAQLASTAPAGATSYMGFVYDPALANWQTVTRDGLVTSQLNTGISKATTAASADAYWFIIDASDTVTPTVKYFILDSDLNLVSSIIEPASLPAATTRLQPIIGLRSTGVGLGLATLLLDHAAVVNQGALVGQGGGPGSGGLSLAQVLINGNTTGTTLIGVNQGSGISGVVDDDGGDGAGFGIFGGRTTLATNDTGSVSVASGTAFLGEAGNPGSTTGNLILASGFQLDGVSQGDTGNIDLQTGDHFGTDGTTGDLFLRTGGFINGGAGTRVQGDIVIAPGTVFPNTATTTGEVLIKGGSSTLNNVAGGDVTITSGENSSAIGDTGDIIIETFDANLDGDSGDLELSTGSSGTVVGDSGNTTLFTGTSPAGSSGSLVLGTGAAGNGQAGDLLFLNGFTSVGDGSGIFLFAGSSADALGVGGDIELTPGSGPAGDGAVIINGKLTVTGIIDPTALVLDGQGVIPPEALPTAGQGTLWVNNTVVPSRLFFTDDQGLATDIGTGGGVTSLGALTDVTLAAPAPGEVLTFNGAQWVNLAGVGGSPLATILGIGNTTGNLPIVISDQPLARIVAETGSDLRLDPGSDPGDAVVIDGLRWPEADGPGGFVLTTNGLGQLSFQPGGGGGGGSSFAESFTRMQWGSIQPTLGGVSSTGIFAPATEVGAVLTTSDTVEGVRRNFSTAAIVGDEAGIQGVGSGVTMGSFPFVSIRFDGVTPDTQVRFFAGLTNDLTPLNTPTVQLNSAFPLRRYIGIQIYTDAPQTTLQFVTDNSTGVPLTFNTAVSPAGLVGLTLTIDGTTPGEVTLALYDSTGTQLSTTTFVANLPVSTAALYPFCASHSIDGLVKSSAMYTMQGVTRADLLNAVGGGGGNQNLASVLGFGRETGGLPITGDNNVGGSGSPLTLVGGNSTGGLGSGGGVTVITGIPDLGGNGAGGIFQVATSPGAGSGNAGGIQMTTGIGGALGGDGGDFTLTLGSGPLAASGKGGDIGVSAGNGGATGGLSGRVIVKTGRAFGGNNVGGLFGLSTGIGFGTGNGGDFQAFLGDGGGAGGDGGSFLFTPGTGMGGGVDGTVTFNGEVFINGKLNVTGLIDPTGLLLTSQGVLPFTPLGADGGIWVNNAGELVYTNAGGDLNLSTAIGGGPTFLDALLTAGYGFLGAGNNFGGPQSYGVYGGSVNGSVSPGPPPASATIAEDGDGPFLNLAVAATPASEAWVATSALQIQPDSRFKARFKFQVTSPAHTDERLFIGFTDDATLVSPSPVLAADHPVPGIQYMGVAQSLAGFNMEFVAQGSGGAMAAVLAIPTDALVHYLEIDASAVTGDTTFTVYASDGVTVEAQHTELASFLLPDQANPLRPFNGIHTATGTTPRGIDFYYSTIVTRADIVDAVTGGGGGGGGISPLSSVLISGNTTGANGIEFSLGNPGITSADNPGGDAGILRMTAGNSTGAGGNGGVVLIEGGVGDGAGAPGGVALVAGGGTPATDGLGDINLASSPFGGDTATAAYGVFSNAEALVGGLVLLQAGSAPVGSGGDGGNITLITSVGDGVGDDGSIHLLADNGVPVGLSGSIEGVAASPPAVGGGGRFHLTPAGGIAAGGARIVGGTGLLGAGILGGFASIAGGVGAQGGPASVDGGNAEAGGGGDGGLVSIRGGIGDGAGDGGNVTVTAGDAGATTGDAGNVNIAAGDIAHGDTAGFTTISGGGGTGGGAVTGQGGPLVLQGGNIGTPPAPFAFYIPGQGGNVTVRGGASDGVAPGGSVGIQGGLGGTTPAGGANGGNVTVRGAPAQAGTDGDGGSVVIGAGAGDGTGVAGQIILEGQLDDAAPGIQFGSFTPPGAGGFVVAFNAVFPGVPRNVQLTLEALAGDVAQISLGVAPGSVTAAGFTLTVISGGAFVGAPIVNWTAIY